MRYIFPQNPRFRLCPFWFETKWLKCLSVVAARVTAHDLNVFKGNGKAPSRFAYVEAQEYYPRSKCVYVHTSIVSRRSDDVSVYDKIIPGTVHPLSFIT